jgi:hypothetical protein
MNYAEMKGATGNEYTGRVNAMQFGKYKIVILDAEICWGGCTRKTCQEWIDYDGTELNEYDEKYLETITKPFIRMVLASKSATRTDQIGN